MLARKSRGSRKGIMSQQVKRKSNCVHIAQDFPIVIDEKSFSVKSMLRCAVRARPATLDDHNVIHDIHDLAGSF